MIVVVEGSLFGITINVKIAQKLLCNLDVI